MAVWVSGVWFGLVWFVAVVVLLVVVVTVVFGDVLLLWLRFCLLLLLFGAMCMMSLCVFVCFVLRVFCGCFVWLFSRVCIVVYIRSLGIHVFMSCTYCVFGIN